MADEESQEAETQAAISAAFLAEAAEASMAPTVINRFQLLQTGMIPGFSTLVLGSSGASEMETRDVNTNQTLSVSKTFLVRIVGSFAVSKLLATDLIVFLEKEFEITEEEKAARRKHYSGQFPASADNG